MEITNSIHFADNLDVLRAIPDGSVGLIYIDPPFNTGKRQERRRMKVVRDEGGDRVGYQGRRYRTVDLGTSGYDDIFEDFIAFLVPRLQEARRVLRTNGSFFLPRNPQLIVLIVA